MSTVITEKENVYCIHLCSLKNPKFHHEFMIDGNCVYSSQVSCFSHVSFNIGIGED